MNETQIEKLETELRNAGFNAKAWQERRIYLNGHGRDINAFFEFDTPQQSCGDVMDGVALKVFSNANQSKAWKQNRVKQIKHQIMQRVQDAGLVDSVCETSEQVII